MVRAATQDVGTILQGLLEPRLQSSVGSVAIATKIAALKPAARADPSATPRSAPVLRRGGRALGADRCRPGRDGGDRIAPTGSHWSGAGEAGVSSITPIANA